MLKKVVFLCSFLIFLTVYGVFADQDNYVAVYYFHTNFRCVSCHKIEQYTGETINKSFTNEIKNGSLKYSVINVEEKGNEHYVKDYQLYTKSVVLSMVKNGKEVKNKNLDKVWQYLSNKDQFMEYVKTETESFLRETK